MTKTAVSDGRCRVHTQILHDPSGDFATALASGFIRDCLLALSVSAWLDGEVGRGIEFASQAAGAAHGGCNGDCARLAKIWHAKLLTRIRDVSAAARVLDGMAIPAGICEGDGVSVALLACRAELALALGDVGAAVAMAELGVRSADRAGVPVLLPTLHIVLTVSAVRQSDMTEGLQYARLLGDDALLGRTAYVRGQSVWAAAQAVEADQGSEGVGHLVERMITDDRLNRELLISQPAAAAWLVRIARAMDDEGLALKCAERAGTLARETPAFRAIQAAALHAGGLFENNPDKLQAASALHLDRWASASANEDEAEIWSARHMGRDRAVELLKYAAASYKEVGAARDVARVASKLRDLGVRAGRVHAANAAQWAHIGISHGRGVRGGELGEPGIDQYPGRPPALHISGHRCVPPKEYLPQIGGFLSRRAGIRMGEYLVGTRAAEAGAGRLV